VSLLKTITSTHVLQISFQANSHASQAIHDHVIYRYPKLKGIAIASLASCKMLFYGEHGFVPFHDDVMKLGPNNSWSWDIAIHHHLFLGHHGSIFDTLRATFVLLYYSSAVP
jgi:hypothetical protein